MDETTEGPHDQRYMDALLLELHAELERAGTLTEQERELLSHLKDDVDDVLRREAMERDEPLGGRLQEAIGAFEATHPDLAVALQRVMDGLSQSGI